MEIIINCELCRCEVIARSKSKRYCDECRKQKDRERDRKNSRKKKLKRLLKDAKSPQYTIRDVCRFEQQYHDQHGVWIGYTKACEMIKNGGKA